MSPYDTLQELSQRDYLISERINHHEDKQGARNVYPVIIQFSYITHTKNRYLTEQKHITRPQREQTKTKTRIQRTPNFNHRLTTTIQKSPHQSRTMKKEAK